MIILLKHGNCAYQLGSYDYYLLSTIKESRHMSSLCVYLYECKATPSC